MGKYFSLFKYELKTIIRDPMNLYMFIFPWIMLFMSAYLFPFVFESISPANGKALQITAFLLIILLLVFNSFIMAAMASFLLLEHKDENTLNTIAVTPIGASGYITFKMTYVYIMSVISTIIVLIGTKAIAGDRYVINGIQLLDNIDNMHIISFSIVSSLFTPALGLIQAAFAKNKVEGFAFIKGTGILAFLPALMLLETFQGAMQYALGIFPSFWAVQGILIEIFPFGDSSHNLSYPMYLVIGGVYSILIYIISYRLFLKKTQY